MRSPFLFQSLHTKIMSKALLTVPVIPLNNCSVNDTTFGRTDNTIQDYLASCRFNISQIPIATAPVQGTVMDSSWLSATDMPNGTVAARIAPRPAPLPSRAGDYNRNVKSIPALWWVAAYYIRITAFSFQALPPLRCVVKYERGANDDPGRPQILFHEEATRQLVIETLGPADPTASVAELIVVPVQTGYIMQSELGATESVLTPISPPLSLPAQPMQPTARTYMRPDPIVPFSGLTDDAVYERLTGATPLINAGLISGAGASYAVNFFFPSLSAIVKDSLPSIQVSPFFVSSDVLNSLESMFL